MKKILWPCLHSLTKLFLSIAFCGIVLMNSFRANAQTPNWAWAKQSWSLNTQYNEGHAICLDAAGNSYITGVLAGTAGTQYFFPGNVTLSVGTGGMFIVKYRTDGRPLWGRQSVGAANSYDVGEAMAIDNSANIYVAGNFQGTCTYGTTSVTSSSSGNPDIFLTKLDSAGNFLWAKKAGGKLADRGRGVATDKAGNVYITGSFTDTAVFDTTSLISAGAQDLFIAKYDAGGNLLWAKKKGGINYEIGYGICTDNSGNIFVTGIYQYATTFDTVSLSGNGYPMFIAKFDSSGKTIWVNKADDPSLFTYHYGYAVDADSMGNCYVTGTFNGTVTFNTTQVTSLLGYDTFIAKYDKNGVLKWVKRAGGNENPYVASQGWDEGRGIKVDASGNIFVGGVYYTNGLFDATSVYGFNQGVYAAKYDSSGTLLWVKTGGINEGWGRGIAIDNYGNCYVTGYYLGFSVYFDSFQLTGNGSGSTTNIFTAKVCTNTPPVPTITASGPTTYCSGVPITLTASTSNAYSWSTGATTQSITAIGSGNITVTSINPGGCTATSSSVTLTSLNAPFCTFTVTPASSCSANDGQVNAKVISGTPPYTYLWSTGATTTTITGLAAGTYSLTTTHANGCSRTQTVTVTCPTAIFESQSQTFIVIFPNPNNGKFTVLINPSTNGPWVNTQIEIYNVLGEKVYEEALTIKGINNSHTISLPSGLGQGIYFLQLKSENGTATKKLIIHPVK